MKYWLMKSEPDVFSIQDLALKGKEAWDGVRNYQARNYMRDEMREGDLALFYHSNAKPSGVAGIGRIAGPSRPDPSAFEPKSPYYDPASRPEAPRWWLVDVEFVECFERVVSLSEMKATPELSRMIILRPGNRLSITPVSAGEFNCILALAHTK